jgi:hypothetical protein
MRIKKNTILEAAANAVANTNTSNTTTTNTSNTTNTQNNNTNKSNLPKPEEIEKSKKAVEDLEKKVGEINNKVKDGPMGAFLKGGDALTENDYPGGEDFGDIGHSDIEYLSDRSEKNRADYDEWLASPEGQEYIKNTTNQNNQSFGTGEDFGDIPTGRDIEVDADNYLDQQDFLNDLNQLDESIKRKRKVIKTIKVKDLKNG